MDLEKREDEKCINTYRSDYADKLGIMVTHGKTLPSRNERQDAEEEADDEIKIKKGWESAITESDALHKVSSKDKKRSDVEDSQDEHIKGDTLMNLKKREDEKYERHIYWDGEEQVGKAIGGEYIIGPQGTERGT